MIIRRKKYEQMRRIIDELQNLYDELVEKARGKC